MSELNLILMGPPGAGKGTQAERLRADFDLPYYATGDILREAVREETELGRQAKHGLGDLVRHDHSVAAARARGVVHFVRGHWGPLAAPRTG